MAEERVYSSDLSYPKEEVNKCLIYRLFGKPDKLSSRG
jgi:hypothetical protein